MGTESLQRPRLRFARYPVWAALCALPAVVGCHDDDDDNGSLPGELGNNHFFYGCSTIDDPQCRDELTSFPEKIAVGARFEIIAKSGDGSRLTVRPASPVMIAPASGGFEFREPGFGAFLAFGSNDFVDFTHLEGVEVDDINVLDAFDSPTDDLVLRRNQQTTLTAVPLDADGDTLAGSLVYRWVSDNEAVLQVEATGTTVKVTARDEGEARLRVSLRNDVSRILNVVVRTANVSPVEDAGLADAGVGDAAVPDGGVSNTTADARVPSGASVDGGETSEVSTSGEGATDAPGTDTLDAASSAESTGTGAALDGGQ